MGEGLTKLQTEKLFARFSNGDLKSLGVSENKLLLVRDVSDIFQLKELKNVLPSDVYAKLEWLTTGFRVNDIVQKDRYVRNQLLKIIDEQVLQPSLDHPELDDDYKESIKDTQRMLNNRKTVKEIMDFIHDALDRKRGKEMYNALKKHNITTFEDIIERNAEANRFQKRSEYRV